MGLISAAIIGWAKKWIKERFGGKEEKKEGEDAEPKMMEIELDWFDREFFYLFFFSVYYLFMFIYFSICLFYLFVFGCEKKSCSAWKFVLSFAKRKEMEVIWFK